MPPLSPAPSRRGSRATNSPLARRDHPTQAPGASRASAAPRASKQTASQRRQRVEDVDRQRRQRAEDKELEDLEDLRDEARRAGIDLELLGQDEDYFISEYGERNVFGQVR